MTRQRDSASSSPRATTASLVLLVDSACDGREMYAEYLRLERCNILEADNTSDAMLCAARADVIVTSIRVPGPFDGIELVRRLREDTRTKNKPIIVLTSCAFESDRQRAWAAGASAFLTKPCLPQSLAATIQRVLAVSSVRPHPAAARPKRSRRDVA